MKTNDRIDLNVAAARVQEMERQCAFLRDIARGLSTELESIYAQIRLLDARIQGERERAS